MPNGEDGPSFEQLLKLRDMLPSLVKGYSRGRIGGRGRAVHMPDKACRVCSKVWGSAPAQKLIEHTVCGDCQNQFDAGFAAAVCNKRIAFLKGKSLKAGEIFYVTEDTMNAIEERSRKNAEGT